MRKSSAVRAGEQERVTFPSHWTAFECAILLGVVAALALLSGAWVHGFCHPSGNVWLSASGRPEQYCSKVAGHHSALVFGGGVTAATAVLFIVVRRRTKWILGIAGVAFLAAIANAVTMMVIYSNG